MKLGAILAIGVGVICLSGCDREPAASTGGEPAQAANDAPPKRAPGLWTMTIAQNGQTNTMTMCLDEAVEQRLSWWGQNSDAAACQEHKVEKTLDGGWTFSSICRGAGGSSITTSGRAVGDFSSRYQVSMEATIIGSAVAGMDGTISSTTEAARTGDCPADMPPGTAELPGGMRVNLLELSAAQP